METADLYIAISRKCPKPGKGFYIYVLEGTRADGSKGASDPCRKEFDDATPHQLELCAIVDGLKRFRRACRVNIHSEHGWFQKIRECGWFDTWQQAGWMTKEGHTAAGAELYQEIYMLETVCRMEIGTIDKDMGSFREWFGNEIKNTVPIL